MDLLTILTLKGIPYKEGTGGEITLCCPFCVDRGESPDTRFRLGINIRHNVGQCFNCQWKARGYAFQALSRKLQFNDVVDVPRGFSNDDEEKAIKVHFPEGFVRLSDEKETGYWVEAARQYMYHRTVTWAQIKRTKVGFTEVGEWAYRVVFPVYYSSRLRGLVGRDITGKKIPKYLNSRGARTLFFSYRAKRKDLLVLSEGIFKCLALESAMASRNCSTAALLGHTITDLQEEQVRKYNRVLLWPDPDKVGIEGMIGVCQQLSNMPVYVPWPPPEKEADEYTGEGIKDFKIIEFSSAYEMRYKLHASGLDE
jgi:hypothetical protein